MKKIEIEVVIMFKSILLVVRGKSHNFLFSMISQNFPEILPLNTWQVAQ